MAIELLGIELCTCNARPLQLFELVITLVCVGHKFLGAYHGWLDVKWVKAFGHPAERIWAEDEMRIWCGRISRAITLALVALYQTLVPIAISEEHQLFDTIVAIAVIKTAVESVMIVDIEQQRAKRIRKCCAEEGYYDKDV